MSTHEEALYVYGFTRPDAVSGSLSVPGVNGAADVRSVSLGAIAAISSPLSMDEFLGPDGDDRTQDLEWVAPRAIRHELVVEEVMRTSPVLPLTFGVVFSSTQALSRAVGSHHGRINQFLDYISDKEEWSLKVFVNARQLRDHLGRSPEFLARLEQLPDAPGARYFHEKKLHRELDQLSRHEGFGLADRIRQELAPLSTEVKPLRLSSREASGRRDDMVLNCAFLTRSDQVERLNQQVEELADQYRQQGLTLEATGPWPPYSFSPSLEAQR